MLTGSYSDTASSLSVKSNRGRAAGSVVPTSVVGLLEVLSEQAWSGIRPQL